MLKKNIKLVWFDGENNKFTVEKGKEFAFRLMLGSLIIGVLGYFDDKWHFSYSEDFKRQKEIQPLINFPDKESDYINPQLWSFFASRIPSLSQRQLKRETADDVQELLKKYGRRVVANPYILEAL